MNILIVNSFHYLRGGDCRNAIELGGLLQKAGHEIHYFAMACKENLPCSDDVHFVKEVDYREAMNSRNPLTALRVLWRSAYSLEAKMRVRRLLKETQPEIIHLHSIRHHLTKSILPEMWKRRIPIVWTLHDYKEICPNTSLYSGQSVCEACKGKNYGKIISYRCKKDSFAASFATYLEAIISDWMVDTEKYINLYISPSKFLRNKFLEYAYHPNKIVHVPNFLELEEHVPKFSFDPYFLFIGRLEKEKGLRTLINGFLKTKASDSSIGLKIAGIGTMKEELQVLIDNLGLSNVELVGFKKGTELTDLTRNAKAIVIPSEYFENYPFSGLEAMAYGKPVIGSRIGGIPEQVEDGATGFLFEPYNAEDLAAKIDLLNSLSERKLEDMGRRGRAKVENENSSSVYLKRLTEIYEVLIEKKKQKAA